MQLEGGGLTSFLPPTHKYYEIGIEIKFYTTEFFLQVSSKGGNFHVCCYIYQKLIETDLLITFFFTKIPSDNAFPYFTAAALKVGFWDQQQW